LARDENRSAGRTQSVIGAGMVVSGDIRFFGGLRIDGKVIGSVRSAEGQDGIVVVSEKGRVEGSVDAARQTINGVVTGRVEARDFVRLQPKAHVRCDISYGAVEIHSGAVLDGRLVHIGHGVKAEGPQAAFEPAAPGTAAIA